MGKFAKSNIVFLKKHHFVAVRIVTFTKKTCHWETFLRSFCERNVSIRMPIVSNDKKRIRKLVCRGQKELKNLAYLSKLWPLPLTLTFDPCSWHLPLTLDPYPWPATRVLATPDSYVLFSSSLSFIINSLCTFLFSELEEALIVLPFSVVIKMLTLLNQWLQVKWCSEHELFSVSF